VVSKKERMEEIEKRILRLVAEGKLSYEEAKKMLQELS
jgi:polyhydroxyalkanoate synthesis regulator phasin